jgi:two-component sensor histidine kinase
MLKLLSEFRRGWREASDPPLALGAGFAALCLLGGTAMRLMVAHFRLDSPFSLYLPAVVLAAVFGGPRVGAATLLGAGLLGFGLRFGSSPTGFGLLATLAIYLAVGAFFIWGVAHYRSLLARQRDFSNRLVQEEQYRKLVVNELQHRLKNKGSTILAVINQSLPDQPEAATKLAGRIYALSLTDDLISQAGARGADIKDLLLSELGPYGHVRFILNGERVSLPAKLAVSLALVFHELATNAAKHGAFSSAQGMLQVSWTAEQGFLAVTWDETEGPAVQAPNHSGFGTKLLKSALVPFQGTVDLQFLRTGVRCTMRCKIPREEAN